MSTNSTDMNNFFRDILSGFTGNLDTNNQNTDRGWSSYRIPPLSSSLTRTIPVRVVKSSSKITVTAEMPGFSKDTINVDFRGPKLKITGKKSPLIQDNETKLSNTIEYGDFSKMVTLPVNVLDKENVSIKYNNGLLLITISLEEEERNSFSLKLETEESKDALP